MRGLIAIHENLLADHLALALDFGSGKNRVEIHVAEHVAQPIEMLHPRLCVIAGVVLGGERIQITADSLDSRRDLARIPALRPLEEEVFEEM